MRDFRCAMKNVWTAGLVWVLAVHSFNDELCAQSRIHFRNQSHATFTHNSSLTDRRHLHLVMDAGVGVLDYDADRIPDIFCMQGAGWDEESRRSTSTATPGLLRGVDNRPFADSAASAFITDSFFGMGVSIADFDADGFSDVYCSSFDKNLFYRNNGDGTFTECAEQAGIGCDKFSSSCSWADIDNDGDLDLFVVNYLSIVSSEDPICSRELADGPFYFGCHPRFVPASYDVVYQNNGNGTFTDVSEIAGLRSAPARQGLGIVAADWDEDGDIDFYVANDSVPNQLWVNDGSGKFVEDAVLSGVAVNRSGASEAGMGVATADFDGDGRLDIMT